MLDFNGNDNLYVGFSDKIYDPAVQAALKKNKRAAAIFFILLILAPIVICIILSVKNDDNSLVAVGFGISAVFLVINIISFISQKTKRQWDGVVVNKYTEVKRRDPNSDSTQTYRTVELRTDSGKKKKISASINPYYEYLNVGDRVRYYPQFNNYYEKYDKTNDTYVICPVCGIKNDITQDTCKRCKVPIIK
ncbi:MAG: hypothetical protein IKS17_01275 [Firmicutes bacterium]|nr:hypothetical protein [Bacillota bacterium]